MTRKHLLALLKSYTAQYDLYLQNAVYLLGGRASLMRSQRFRKTLSAIKPKYQHICRELNCICDLLSLDIVGDISSDEPAYFALIDPVDDVVWTICVLADIAQGLSDDFYEFLETSEIDLSEVAA
tara:strand:+ start:13039 stop:13413 length:375 start_codon:yes stop_codon:yes gene_type:complete